MADEDDHAFVARFGNTVIRGGSFDAVGDALVERGFRMVDAFHVGPGEIEVPHTKSSRASARLKAKAVVPEAPTELVVSEETTLMMARVEMATAAVMSGANPPVGDFGSRFCGSVHSDGVVCLIAVMVEKVNECECCGGEIVYHHEGPHEATDEDGVQYRWTAVTVIQDHEYNGYIAIDPADSEPRG